MGNENELEEDGSNEGWGRERGHCCVEVGDRKLESVEVTKYLGIMISGNGRMEEIRSRIGKVARIIGVLNELVWKQLQRNKSVKRGREMAW